MDDKGCELSKSKQVDNPIENNSFINKKEDSQTKLTPVLAAQKACI